MKYSIIIVGYKALEQLDRCLESLIAHPPEREEPGDLNVPAEIILIDNSPEQLKPLEDSRTFKKLLRTYTRFVHEWHPENLGFAAACNRGVELSGGDTIVLVNPDTMVFPEWAERLSAHLQPGIGAVGPISNFVAAWQNAALHMQIPDTWEKTARYAIKGNSRRGVDTKLLIGYFMMIPRKVWDEVGGLDPQFFLGCDDLDFSMRVREAGYSLVIASDVFVYHEGHSSFHAAGIESMNLNKRSEKAMLAKLQARYGDNIPTSTDLWGCEILPTLISKRMTLSVCMIVRDDEKNLAELLPQLGFADEVVIVDTKPDREWAILPEFIEVWVEEKAPQMAGKVKAALYPWIDDFAAARNFALSKCTGDYILWLDADDRVTSENAALIRAALDYPGPLTAQKKAHFGFTLRDHGPDGIRYAHGQARLFPRIEGLKWEGRAHESYLPTASALGLFKVDTSITIDHTGYQDPEVMLKKHARNLRLMRMEPDSPKKFYHMGKNLHALGEYEEARKCFSVVLSDCWAAPLEKPFSDQVRYCMASLIISELGEAHPSIDQYLADNDKPDALFMRAEVALKRAQVFEAEAMFKEYAALGDIIDSHGSEQAYLQAIARQRLEIIQKTREEVYAR
jgi:GT2 family glycosyltransferase